MWFWLKSFIRENYLALKITFFITMLVLLFTNALIMVFADYPTTTDCSNSFNTNSRYSRVFNETKDDTLDSSSDKEALKASVYTFFDNVFKTRNKAFLDGNIKDLYDYFVTTTSDGKYSIHHELKRIAYVRDWAEERNIKFVSITSYPSLKYVTGGPNNFNVRIDEEYKFEYVYKDEPELKNEFGIALFHIATLNKDGDSYKIAKDYFLDSFEDGFKIYNFNLDEKDLPLTKGVTYNINFKRDYNDIPCSSNFNRFNCKEYADKYCGVTWASENKDKYNKKYFNFTGSGGNCTNFVSQCLSDKEGGNMKSDYTWYFSSNKQEGSPAWVNANSFKDYILYNGKGKVIKYSDFVGAMNTLDDGTSVFSHLEIGDIISYASKGHVEHNAIITNFDSKGYPLINSHTVDRYQVPFDLGWGDKGINFYFIHILI